MPGYVCISLWMQKERYKGLKEYCKLIKEVCKGKPGVEFFGIYKPLNEHWNWAYIIRINDLNLWRQIDNEISEKYREHRENITQSMTRLYSIRSETPKPEKTDEMKYFLEEMETWEGYDIGLDEWYEMEVRVFDKKEGLWFMGLYTPWTSGYNWTHLMMFDTMDRLLQINKMCNDAYGRQERTILTDAKLFERYEPD
jgi:hypothetical protein